MSEIDFSAVERVHMIGIGGIGIDGFFRCAAAFALGNLIAGVHGPPVEAGLGGEVPLLGEEPGIGTDIAPGDALAHGIER